MSSRFKIKVSACLSAIHAKNRKPSPLRYSTWLPSLHRTVHISKASPIARPFCCLISRIRTQFQCVPFPSIQMYNDPKLPACFCDRQPTFKLVLIPRRPCHAWEEDIDIYSFTTSLMLHLQSSEPRSREAPTHFSHFLLHLSSSSLWRFTNSGPTSNSSPTSQSSLRVLAPSLAVLLLAGHLQPTHSLRIKDHATDDLHVL